MTKDAEAKARLAKAEKRRERLLRELKQRKYSCHPKDLETALDAWGFDPGDKKGQSQVWSYKHITLTIHPAHGKRGGNDADAGAVARVIQMIEQAKTLQEKEKQEKSEAAKDVN